MLRRLFYCLLGLSGISPILAVKPINPVEPIPEYNVYIEPLSVLKRDTRIVFVFPATKTNKITSNVILINNNRPNGAVIASATSTSAPLKKTVIFNNIITLLNNKIKIETTTSVGKLVTNTVDIQAYTRESFTLDSSKQTLKDPYPCTYLKSGELLTRTFTYKFEGFEKEYSPDYYHFYSPKSLKVTSTSPLDFSSAEIYLYLTNREGVFDDMYVEKGLLKVPLAIDAKGRFMLNEIYYVDPVTLRMARYKKPGYVETSYLYLPKDEMRYQGEYAGMIKFSNFGCAHSNVTYNFSLNALSNIMGDCINSEFCILKSK